MNTRVSLASMGFTSTKSSPYYSQGHGKAESVVKIAKNMSEKSRNEDPYLALLVYRNTPQQGYHYSPAGRLMSLKLRDIIPTATSQLLPKLTCPRVVQENIAERRNRSKVQYDKKALTPLREFTEGEKVYLKPCPTNRSQPWIHGKVVEEPTPRSCVVKTAMGPVRRNYCQIRRAKAEPADGYSTVMYALRARTGETTTKLWLNRRKNTQHTQNRIRRHVTCNDRMYTAPITTWAQTQAFKIQRLRHVKKTVLIELVSETTTSRDCFNRTSLLCFLFACFLFAWFFLKREDVTQLCITCFVAPTSYYHIIARTFVYFGPLHTLLPTSNLASSRGCEAAAYGAVRDCFRERKNLESM